MQVDLSPDAKASLQQLYIYVQADFTAAGAAWFRGLQQTIASLANLPLRGKLLRPGSRERRLLYGRGHNVYSVIYRADLRREAVLIVRITHGRTRAAVS